MGNRLRAVVERLLPWYSPVMARQHDRISARIARRSEAARLRASRVIDEYRRAEDVSDHKIERVTQVVADLRIAQDAAKDAAEVAKEAGERVIAEVETT